MSVNFCDALQMHTLPAESVCVLVDSITVLAAELADQLGCISGLNMLGTSSEALLADDRLHQVGCVVAGLTSDPLTWQLPRTLNERLSPLQVIYLTAESDPRPIVAASQAGACDIVVWPQDSARLVAAVARALRVSEREQAELLRCRQARELLSRLTDRECEVVDLMLAGNSNKKIAARLDLSLRTVELRRKEIFTKLNTRNLAAILSLIQLANRSFVPGHEATVRSVPHPHFGRPTIGSGSLPEAVVLKQAD